MTVKYQLDADVHTEHAEQAHRRTEAIAEKHGGCVWHWSDAALGAEGPKSRYISAVLAVLRFEGAEPSDEFYEALYSDLHDVFKLTLRLKPLVRCESTAAEKA